MKIKNMVLPKIIPYYLSPQSIELLTEKLYESDIEIKHDELHVYRDNMPELFDVLNLLKKKSEKITSGDSNLYEYELGISIPNGEIFTFTLDNNITYNTSLYYMNNLVSSDLHIVFKIKDAVEV